MKMIESVKASDGEIKTSSEAASLAMQAHLRGDLAQAERLYRHQLQREDRCNPVVWTNLGQLLRQSGRHAEALECYRHASQLPNAPVATHFNLGNVLMDSQQFGEAEASYRIVLEREPGMLAARLQLARCLTRQKRIPEALSLYLYLIQCDSDNYSVWLELGNIQRGLGQAVAAIESYRMSVQCAPDRWGCHASLARMLEERGDTEGAAQAYRQAVSLTSNDWPVREMMGRSRLERGDLAGALEAFVGAFVGNCPDAEPGVAAMIEAGNVLMSLGRPQDAFNYFTQAAQTHDERLLLRLAEVLFPHNLWAEAVAVLQRAVTLYPDNVHGYLNLAHGHARSWQLEAALNSLAEAKAHTRERSGVLPLEAIIYDRLGDAKTASDLYRQIVREQGRDAVEYRSSAAYSSLYVETLTPQEMAEIHMDLFQAWMPTARERSAWQAACKQDKDPVRRLRIGYLTSDLHHQHPVNIFMQPILAHHDASAMDIAVYNNGRIYDEQTHLAKSRVRLWRDVAGLSDAALGKRILDDGIDILVDLAGHTSGNRMRLLSRRVAPVQVSFLGYPHSTWVPEMDWLIGDPVVTPVGSESLFSEKILRLPHSVFCYRPEQDYPLTWKKRETELVFGSFNNINKVGERTIRLWARVLDRVPGSRLLLKAPSFRDPLARRRYREIFARHGVGDDRLELRGPSGLTDMMAEYADVDIGLDPLQYNGGTTTLQALWMGVPVITLTGGNFAQRMASSFLRQIDRQAWVAHDEESYVRNAARLAADRTALAAEKATLRERMLASPLSDIETYTRSLERALRTAWRHYCDSPPV